MTKKEMEKKRDELAEDCATFCRCSGPTCSGCEESTKKLIKTGWDACAEEYEDLEEKLNKAIEALEFYASGWTMGFHAGELLVSTGIELNFEEVHQRARKTLKEIKGE